MELPGIGFLGGRFLSILSIFLLLSFLSHMTKTNRKEDRAHLEQKLTINKKQSGSPTVPGGFKYLLHERWRHPRQTLQQPENLLSMSHCFELNYMARVPSLLLTLHVDLVGGSQLYLSYKFSKQQVQWEETIFPASSKIPWAHLFPIF